MFPKIYALTSYFILQGHMYLFTHYICFYSNIFGFETKVSLNIDYISTYF